MSRERIHFQEGQANSDLGLSRRSRNFSEAEASLIILAGGATMFGASTVYAYKFLRYRKAMENLMDNLLKPREREIKPVTEGSPFAEILNKEQASDVHNKKKSNS